MIVITVKKQAGIYKSFTSSGHAGYAKSGEDIVCAAVSALIITTVNGLETFTEDQIDLKEKDGFVSFTFLEEPSEKGRLLMDTLLLGLTDIENTYQNRYLTVKVREV
jgi:hypothetical protein